MKNIHVLPTEMPSRIYYNKLDKTYQLCEFHKYHTDIKSTHNIYITSDEEIKEGDEGWCYTNGSHFINSGKGRITTKVINYNDKNGLIFKKIILTTDSDLINDGVQAIDDEFLEWFVKNSSCEFVEVEKWTDYKLENDKEIPFFSYKIIIPKEETKQTDENGKPLTYWGGKQELPIANNTYSCTIQTNKQETLEEAAEKYANDWEEIHPTLDPEDMTPITVSKIDFIEGVKWHQERSYSEQDIAPLLKFINDCDFNWDCDNDAHRYNTNCRACDARKILEQFKKK